jgi:hypothetical protein
VGVGGVGVGGVGAGVGGAGAATAVRRPSAVMIGNNGLANGVVPAAPSVDIPPTTPTPAAAAAAAAGDTIDYTQTDEMVMRDILTLTTGIDTEVAAAPIVTPRVRSITDSYTLPYNDDDVISMSTHNSARHQG